MFANKVVNATVAALNIFAAKVPTVAFNRVVEPKVEDPETDKLFKFAVDAPKLAVDRFARVVLPRVEEPVTSKLAVDRVPETVDEEILRPMKFAFAPAQQRHCRDNEIPAAFAGGD